jgi:hypothetical protein
MKRMKWILLSVLSVLLATSCTTVYDNYGRPQTVVDPGAAAIGIAAAGVIGYAIGNNNNYHHNYYRPHYYRPRYHCY